MPGYQSSTSMSACHTTMSPSMVSPRLLLGLTSIASRHSPPPSVLHHRVTLLLSPRRRRWPSAVTLLADTSRQRHHCNDFRCRFTTSTPWLSFTTLIILISRSSLRHYWSRCCRRRGGSGPSRHMSPHGSILGQVNIPSYYRPAPPCSTRPTVIRLGFFTTTTPRTQLPHTSHWHEVVVAWGAAVRLALPAKVIFNDWGISVIRLICFACTSMLGFSFKLGHAHCQAAHAGPQDLHQSHTN